ncbi:hypothetical protein MSG28_000357, partial [Choristoneura fumiferana]
VVHAAVGLVPSGVATTLAQVYSRVFLVIGALLATASAPRSPGLPLCILAWSITESIRYAYYALNLVKLVPRFLLVTSYYHFLIFYMFLYIPLFPVLFGHMMSQRRKMLGADPKKSR